MSSLRRKRKSITKDIISIRINDKNNYFRHRQNLRGRSMNISNSGPQTYFNFPPSECPPELAAGGRLCAYKVWCYRKHRCSRCTGCPQCLSDGEVCSAFPGLGRNFHEGCWPLHLETSLMIALGVSFCWKHFVGVAAWPRMGCPPPAHHFCSPQRRGWCFLQSGHFPSGSLPWAAPETQKSTNKGKKAHFQCWAGPLQHLPPLPLEQQLRGRESMRLRVTLTQVPGALFKISLTSFVKWE